MTAQVVTYKRSNALALVSFSCCEETKNALLVGVKERTESVSQPHAARSTSKPLKDRLNNDNLLEYCFMIWGITEKQALQLFADDPEAV